MNDNIKVGICGCKHRCAPPTTYKTIILKPNCVCGHNTLTQEMLSEKNTKYVIKYDFTLGGEQVIVPEECILEFDGGSLRNGTIVGNNTGIVAPITKIFSTDIVLSRTWDVEESYPEWFGAKADGITDDSESIQKCIDSFDVIRLSNKDYSVGSFIKLNKELVGQINTKIIPTFDGDCIGLVRGNTDQSVVKIKDITILCNVGSVETQPRTGTPGSAIVVGYNGSYLQHSIIENVVVRYFYGNAFEFYCGDKPIFYNCVAFHCTGDGFLFPINSVYNNEALLVNTQVLRCNVGYNILADDNTPDGNPTTGYGTRCHVFDDAKAFCCSRNYFINTIGCNGTIMSEQDRAVNDESAESGPYADKFGQYAKGNYICMYSTRTMRNVWIDEGSGNTLSGYDMWKQWIDTKRYVEQLLINKRQQGYQVFEQIGNLEFKDSFLNANSVTPVKVHHTKGDNKARRTDDFEDLLALLDINDLYSHSYFEPAEGIPNLYPPAFLVKNANNEQSTFKNGFVVASQKIGNNRSWCIGTKDNVFVEIYRDNLSYFRADGYGSKLRLGAMFAYPLLAVSGVMVDAPTNRPAGFQYFATDLRKPICWNGSMWIEPDGATMSVPRSGTFANRPTNANNLYEGFKYMINDTNLHFPIYAHIDGDTIEWYKADGTRYGQ